MGALILTRESYELWRKMERLSDDRGVPFKVLWLTFEMAEEYLNSPDKDQSYWRQKLFKRVWAEQVEIFKNVKFTGALKRLRKNKDRLLDPVDPSEVSIEEWEFLTSVAGDETVRMYHWGGLLCALHEVKTFFDKTGKHSFEFVTEDMKEDIPTFLELQRSIKRAQEED